MSLRFEQQLLKSFVAEMDVRTGVGVNQNVFYNTKV